MPNPPHGSSGRDRARRLFIERPTEPFIVPLRTLSEEIIMALNIKGTAGYYLDKVRTKQVYRRFLKLHLIRRR